VAKTYTGMRWGEVLGLERKYVRDDIIRVEPQLYELDSEFIVGPPKDDSYRSLDSPRWLTGLLRWQAAQRRARACPCHGIACVFRGRGTGVRVADLVRRFETWHVGLGCPRVPSPMS
jgi:hypothetical protein